MNDSKISPQEIFQRREELGLSFAIDMLAEFIESEEKSTIRKDAIKYIGLIRNSSTVLKKQQFEILENILVSDEGIEVKCEAAKSLGNIKYEKAIKPLKWLLKQEKINHQVKYSALKAIPNVKFQESEIKIFIKELDSNYPSIKKLVRNQLINLSPEKLIIILIESLNEEIVSDDLGNEIIKLIGYELSTVNVSIDDFSFIKAKYPEVLTILIKSKNLLLKIITTFLQENDKELMESAITILRVLGDEINEKIIELLGDEDFIVKKNAIKLVGKLKLKAGVNSLIKNLDDVYSEVSKASIEALGEIGDISTVPELLIVLDIEAVNFEFIDLDLKFFILDAVKKIYLNMENPSYDYLYYTLKSDNDILKESVAFIIGELAKDEFVDPLLEVLKERNFDVRKNVIIALGKIGDIKAVDPLIDLLNDKEIYWLLKKVICDACYNIFRLSFYKVKDFRSEIGRFFVSRTEHMIDFLNQNPDEYFKVKLSVIKFLEMFGGKSALNALIKLTNDFPRVVRINASKTIAKIEKRLELEEELNDEN